MGNNFCSNNNQILAIAAEKILEKQKETKSLTTPQENKIIKLIQHFKKKISSHRPEEKTEDLKEKLFRRGKHISIDLFNQATPNAILQIEKKLMMFKGNAEDRKTIDPNCIIRSPFQFHVDNSIYHGWWNFNGTREGYGVWIESTGKKFEGLWKNDKIFQGRIYETTGAFYEGDISENIPHGVGKYFCANNDVYIGYWDKGEQNFLGVRKYKDGKHYVGTFLQNKFHGKGKLTWNDGSTYEGNFEYGIISGKGIFRKANGDCYEGSFANNFPDGHGIYTATSNQISYEGEMNFGLFDRNGKLSIGKDFWYKGKFSSNTAHGPGECKYGETLIKGFWRFGRLVEVYQEQHPNVSIPCVELNEEWENLKDIPHLNSTEEYNEGKLLKMSTFRPKIVV